MIRGAARDEARGGFPFAGNRRSSEAAGSIFPQPDQPKAMPSVRPPRLTPTSGVFALPGLALVVRLATPALCSATEEAFFEDRFDRGLAAGWTGF